MAKWHKPEQNWSMLPHQFIDEVMPEISSLSEMKVILYILRHTWGFHQDDRIISLDEFKNGRKYRDPVKIAEHGERMDKGCKMSTNAIKAGIKQAIEHGFIEKVTDDSDKARVKNNYRLAFEDELPSNSEYQELTPGVSKVDSQPSKVDSRTKKETIERKEEKELSSSDDGAQSDESEKFDSKQNAYDLAQVANKRLNLHNGREWNIAHMLNGTCKKKGYKEYAQYFVDKPCLPHELEATIMYYRQKNPNASRMQSPEVIADWVGKYRESLTSGKVSFIPPLPHESSNSDTIEDVDTSKLDEIDSMIRSIPSSTSKEATKIKLAYLKELENDRQNA